MLMLIYQLVYRAPVDTDGAINTLPGPPKANHRLTERATICYT